MPENSENSATTNENPDGSGVPATEGGDKLSPLDKKRAKILTVMIKGRLTSMANMIEELPGLVREAHDGRAWEALDYETWPAYVIAEFGPVMARLGTGYRRELLPSMPEMTKGELAEAFGVDARTIQRDRNPDTYEGQKQRQREKPKPPVVVVVPEPPDEPPEPGDQRWIELVEAGRQAAGPVTIDIPEDMTGEDIQRLGQEILEGGAEGPIHFRKPGELLAKLHGDDPPEPVTTTDPPRPVVNLEVILAVTSGFPPPNTLSDMDKRLREVVGPVIDSPLLWDSLQRNIGLSNFSGQFARTPKEQCVFDSQRCLFKLTYKGRGDLAKPKAKGCKRRVLEDPKTEIVDARTGDGVVYSDRHVWPGTVAGGVLDKL